MSEIRADKSEEDAGFLLLLPRVFIKNNFLTPQVLTYSADEC